MDGLRDVSLVAEPSLRSIEKIKATVVEIEKSVGHKVIQAGYSHSQACKRLLLGD